MTFEEAYPRVTPGDMVTAESAVRLITSAAGHLSAKSVAMRPPCTALYVGLRLGDVEHISTALTVERSCLQRPET